MRNFNKDTNRSKNGFSSRTCDQAYSMVSILEGLLETKLSSEFKKYFSFVIEYVFIGFVLLSIIGRFLALMIEIHLIKNYIKYLIDLEHREKFKVERAISFS